MVQIQQALNRRVIAQDNRYNYQANRINHLYTSTFEFSFRDNGYRECINIMATEEVKIKSAT